MSERSSALRRFANKFSLHRSQASSSNNLHERTIRVTVVGDGLTGKTCLLTTYRYKLYNDVYIPQTLDPFSRGHSRNGQVYNLILQDMMTLSEDNFRLHPAPLYFMTDVFIICYAIDDRDSYLHVQEKWVKEVRLFRPKSKIILIATKIDKRKLTQPMQPIPDLLTFEDGRRLQAKIGADDFLECSAKELLHIDDVFSAVLNVSCVNPLCIVL